MSRRGWGGAPPNDDEEARARVLEAAVRCLERRGPQEMSLSDVATELGVTRQTIYRYFPSTAQLFAAVASAANERLMLGIRAAVAGITDPAEFVVESMAYVIERLPMEPHLTLFIDAGSPERFSRGTVNRAVLDRNIALYFGASAIDWASYGYDEQKLRELLELIHRLVHSMASIPADPPRRGDELRAYLRRWVGTTVPAHTDPLRPSGAPGRPS
ncbi:DNA-binding transcriptional regulator, AcrR family [Parafrankia irregularis]|uniref:DNA-binding transcriptional regulator, AcrR family n=1 Tax=Parafrankia irregularis TaxID=795642 RepID=A0A0S4QKX7_9ACTN|nr:TetR/AcrR family transcriptional regulator [Parafrankia sp. CH37]CUU56208.1 DNA-binding transcriptional regulator, AcrR family [Parafrankia irregularis]